MPQQSPDSADSGAHPQRRAQRNIIHDAAARPVLDEEIKRAFSVLADEYAEVSARLFADDPDLSVEPVEDDE